MKVWDINSKRSVFNLDQEEEHTVSAMKLTKNQKMLICATNEGTIDFWDFKIRHCVEVWESSTTEPQANALTHDDQTLLISDGGIY